MKTGQTGAETYCGSSRELELPTGWYFGVTATTGHLADNQDIHSFVITPAAGVHLQEEGPDQSHPVHDPKQAAEHKEYWRARTPEEKAADEEKKKQEEEKEKQEV